MDSGLISVVIPALNEGSEIAAALARLRPLRERGHEVIVVDGGSTDGTREAAAPLADQVLTSSPGRGRQMNLGAEVARNDILLFLHADTTLPSDADRLIRRALSRTDRGWGRFDVELSGTHPLLRLIGRAISVRSRITGSATGDQAIFVRRSWFERVGGYREIPLMEDLELSRTLKRIGRPVCIHQPVVTSSRRWEERGIVKTILLMWRLRLSYYLGIDPSELARRYQ